MSNKGIELRNEFVSDVKCIITSARDSAIRSVDFERVKMYWKLGERIFVEEQDGKDRAEYGSYLIRNLSASISPEFGSGFPFGYWSSVASFIVHIQLRTHCVRN